MISEQRCPVGDHCACQTEGGGADLSELHRLIHAGWYNAKMLLTPDDSPYRWLKNIHDEWVEVKAGRRALDVGDKHG